MKKIAFPFLLFFGMLLSSGCVAVKVVDTAASATVGAAVGATKLAVKGTKAVVGAALPDDDKKKKKQ